MCGPHGNYNGVTFTKFEYTFTKFGYGHEVALEVHKSKCTVSQLAKSALKMKNSLATAAVILLSCSLAVRGQTCTAADSQVLILGGGWLDWLQLADFRNWG